MRLLVLLMGVGAAVPSAYAQSQQLILARQHIKHVIIIMQENRSFDHYFGTFPGAVGIPAGACIPDNPSVAGSPCTAPYHDTYLVNAGGPHTNAAFLFDLDRNRMDGFILSQQKAPRSCTNPTNPICAGLNRGVASKDVVGYHDNREIPNYWTYAQKFVLQDHMFESVANWSWPEHLAMVSGWFASCPTANPMSCVPVNNVTLHNNLPWTYLPWLLDQYAVSWKYYLGEGPEPDCSNGQMTCAPYFQTATVPSIWNPIPAFSLFTSAVTSNPAYQLHVTKFDTLLLDLKNGALPNVAWIVPNKNVSEHEPYSIKAGMNYVTAIINAVAQSPSANDTAIFLSWDDWGGFYDHVVPPRSLSKTYGWGIRVPGILISAWAKTGSIDHQYLSFDNYNRLIEDLFTNSERLDPLTDGRPDSRPAVTEAITNVRDRATNALIPVGDLLNEFDFTGAPRPISVLPLVP